MAKKFLLGLSLLALSFAFSCQSAPQSNTANTNSNSEPVTTAAPDNSEITTTENNGTRTQTRAFRNNPRVSKVVVTTKDGQRTTTVYSKTGEAKEIKDDVGDALNATGDKLADAAGFAKDKTETAVDKTKEGAKTAADKTKEGAQTVANKSTETAKTVANKSKEGAKTVANKTVEGAKKTGRTIKRVVTP